MIFPADPRGQRLPAGRLSEPACKNYYIIETLGFLI